MANATDSSLLVDGPRNVVVKFDIDLDTSDITTYATVLNPAALYSDPTAPTLNLRMDRIDYSIDDTLTLQFYWGNTVNANSKHLFDIYGRGKYPVGDVYGGIQNPKGAGSDGTIRVNTQGWGTGAILHASFIMHCVKVT